MESSKVNAGTAGSRGTVPDSAGLSRTRTRAAVKAEETKEEKVEKAKELKARAGDRKAAEKEKEDKRGIRATLAKEDQRAASPER